MARIFLKFFCIMNRFLKFFFEVFLIDLNATEKIKKQMVFLLNQYIRFSSEFKSLEAKTKIKLELDRSITATELELN